MKSQELFHNRYELIKRIGVGGFSQVWLARDTKSELEQAIKIFSKQDEEGIMLCRSEYIKTHRLRHPNILTPTFFDVCDSMPYLVFPYISGGNLESHLGKMTIDQFRRLVSDIGSALEYLHSLEPAMSHNDIKPDNILIDFNGRFLLTDFGISNRLKTILTQTMVHAQSYQSYGGATPIAYRAPELFDYTDWKKTAPSSASDVWAFTCTLYHVYFGQLPFNGEGGMGQLILNQRGSLGIHEMLRIGSTDIPFYASQLIDALSLGLAIHPHQRCDMRRLTTEIMSIKKEESFEIEHCVPSFSAPVAPQKSANIGLSRNKWMLWLMSSFALFFGLLVLVFYRPSSDSYQKNNVNQMEKLESKSIALDENSDTFSVASLSSLINQMDSMANTTTRRKYATLESKEKTIKQPIESKRKKEGNKSASISPSYSLSQIKNVSSEISKSERQNEDNPQLESISVLPEDTKKKVNSEEDNTTQKLTSKADTYATAEYSDTPTMYSTAWVTYNLEVPLAIQIDIPDENVLREGQMIPFLTVVNVQHKGETIIGSHTVAHGKIVKKTKRKLTINIDQVMSSGGDPIRLYKSTYELSPNQDFFAKKNNIFFAYTNEQKPIRIIP